MIQAMFHVLGTQIQNEVSVAGTIFGCDDLLSPKKQFIKLTKHFKLKTKLKNTLSQTSKLKLKTTKKTTSNYKLELKK